MHNYHDSMDCFPMSMGLDSPGFGYPEPVSYSGLSMLLSYMEQSVVFNSINYSLLRGDPGNNTATATSQSSFVCPSDPQQGNLPPGQAGECYHPNSGNGIQYVSGASDPWNFNTGLPPFNGVFYPVSRTRIAEITDGTSNTAAFSEMGLGDESNGIATERTDQFWTQTWPSTTDQAISDCQSFQVTNLSFQGLSTDGVPWLEGSTSAAYNHANVPNKLLLHLPPGRIMNTANRLPPQRREDVWALRRRSGPVREGLDQPTDMACPGILARGGEVIRLRLLLTPSTEETHRCRRMNTERRRSRAFRRLSAPRPHRLGCGGQKTGEDPDRIRAHPRDGGWTPGATAVPSTICPAAAPPIVVADPSWKAGFKLSRYQVAESARAVAGFDLEKIPVELWLEDPKGKAVQQKVKYTVSVEPSRTVIRSPL